MHVSITEKRDTLSTFFRGGLTQISADRSTKNGIRVHPRQIISGLQVRGVAVNDYIDRAVPVACAMRKMLESRHGGVQ